MFYRHLVTGGQPERVALRIILGNVVQITLSILMLMLMLVDHASLCLILFG